MIHSYQRYSNIRTWIPESDIEGTDVRDQFCADCRNADFENGFIEPARTPRSIDIPATIQAKLDAGYEILSTKHFLHSTQGNRFLYILYGYDGSKFGSGHLIEFWLYNEDFTVEEELTYDNDEAIFWYWDSKPVDISYNYANDSFKINLNTKITYALDVDKEITLVGNFALHYLDEEKKYATGHTWTGWYLMPRWIGWQGLAWSASGYIKGSNPGLTEENFAGVGGSIPNISLDGNLTEVTYVGKTVVKNATTGIASGVIEVTNLSNVRKVSFVATSDLGGGIKVEFYKSGELVWVEQQVVTPSGALAQFNAPILGVITIPVGSPAWTTYEFEPKLFMSGLTMKVTLMNLHEDGNHTYIDKMSLYPYEADRLCLIAKMDDGQRGQVYTSKDEVTYGVSVYSNYIFLHPDTFDYRIQQYELYWQREESGVYVLVQEYEVNNNFLADGDYYKYSINAIPQTTTLNFNYGLGASIFVVPTAEDGLRGHYIYSEAFYRGRAYGATRTSKFVMSHLSGTGRHQPDCFPYSEDANFGFIQFTSPEISKVIAVTNMNELLVITDRRAKVYSIRGSGVDAFREVKTINGSSTITSEASLCSELDGSPSASFLLWSDYYGVYAYGGGLNQPKDISVNLFKNFWKELALSTKDDVIIFNHRAKNEVWIVIGSIIIVFAIDFGTARLYQFEQKIVEYVGEKDQLPYFRTEDNKINYYDLSTTSRLNGYVETHFSIDYDTDDSGRAFQRPELVDKIMQELYIVQKDDDGTGYTTFTITADDNIISPTINMLANRRKDYVLSPLLIRYGKVKLKLAWGSSYKNEIKEFGYSFNIPGQSPGAEETEGIKGIGMEAGGEHGVVF